MISFLNELPRQFEAKKEFTLCIVSEYNYVHRLQYSNFNIAIWYQNSSCIFQNLISVLTFQSIFWQLSLQYNACLHPPHLRKGFFLVILFALLNVEGPSTNAGAHHSTIHSWPFSSFKNFGLCLNKSS